MATPFPIERYLVPATVDPIPGATSETRALANGLPDPQQLDADVSVVVTLPIGTATVWRDADPGALVASSAPELEPWTPAPDTAIGDLGRPPVRLLVLFQGAPVASVPLAAGLHRVAEDDGNPTTGALVELRVVSWEIHAGSLRGPGDFGSSLRFEWRRTGRGTPHFEPPAVNPHVAARLQRPYALESRLGLSVLGAGAAA